MPRAEKRREEEKEREKGRENEWKRRGHEEV